MDIFQKKIYERPQVLEKMLNIPNHQRNGVKSTRYYLTPTKMATNRKERDNKCPITATASWYCHYGKQNGGSSKN